MRSPMNLRSQAAPRAVETGGSGNARHPRLALTPAGVAAAAHPGPARHAHPVASSGLASPLAVQVASRTAGDSAPCAATVRDHGAGQSDLGEERIANELRLKLGLMVSPRTVGRYIWAGRPWRGGGRR